MGPSGGISRPRYFHRIAGEVLLDHVIGTSKPSRDHTPSRNREGAEPSINLIGEYNIAGDLQQVEPILKRAGVPILSRITGNATFEEITHAHRAKLNVMVCSRALINVAREMERRYGIPYVEVSFFGKTEMSKALRAIAGGLGVQRPVCSSGERDRSGGIGYFTSIGGPSAARMSRTGIMPVKVREGVTIEESAQKLMETIRTALPPWLKKRIGVG